MVKLKFNKLLADCAKSFSAFYQTAIGYNNLIADLIDTDSGHYLILDSPIMVKELSTLNVAPRLSIFKMKRGTSIRFSGTG